MESSDDLLCTAQCSEDTSLLSTSSVSRKLLNDFKILNNYITSLQTYHLKTLTNEKSMKNRILYIMNCATFAGSGRESVGSKGAFAEGAPVRLDRSPGNR